MFFYDYFTHTNTEPNTSAINNYKIFVFNLVLKGNSLLYK